MLWIFLDYSVPLLFKALCLLSCQLSYNGSFLHVYGKPSSVVIVFLWDSCSYHLLCERFTTEPFSNASVRYHRSFHQPDEILYQFLSFNIPSPCGNYKFIFQPWQGQTWGFWSFFFLTASNKELPYCFPGPQRKVLLPISLWGYLCQGPGQILFQLLSLAQCHTSCHLMGV